MRGGRERHKYSLKSVTVSLPIFAPLPYYEPNIQAKHFILADPIIDNQVDDAVALQYENWLMHETI